MNSRLIVALAIALCAISFNSVAGDSVEICYTPTPYPAFIEAGEAMPAEATGGVRYGTLHKDAPDAPMETGVLRVDSYRSKDTTRMFLWFDRNGLPRNNVALHLALLEKYSRSDYIQLAFCRMDADWDHTTTWGTQPDQLSSCAKKGRVRSDSGVAFEGDAAFLFHTHGVRGGRYKYGSSWATFCTPHDEDITKRPRLCFSSLYPEADLKLPLPGGRAWLVTRDMGGYDCMGRGDMPDTAHTGNSYFTVAFSAQHLDEVGSVVLAGDAGDVPVLASGRGVVTHADEDAHGGYRVIIDHDGDGDLNTGVSTFYSGLPDPATTGDGTPITVGMLLEEGDMIGFMSAGDVGLRFGIRRENKGDAGSRRTWFTAKILLEGQLLKSYHTRCTVGDDGIPAGYDNYFTSTNVQYR